MSETIAPSSPMVDIPKTPEAGSDRRSKVIGAFNRTMDRITQERDAIVAKIRSEGQGFLTDHDRMVVLATQYAEEGAKKLTGGNTRLSDDVAKDKFPVEVEDRTTGQQYIREEGIPVGGLVAYLGGEERRLGELEKQAREEGRHDDALGFSKEVTKIWADNLVLIGNSPHGYWSLINDWSRDLPADVKSAARSNPAGIVNYYNTNRVGTEAYLRSKNPVIQGLGGESQDENWIRAEQDILEHRLELEIPAKGTKDPIYEPSIRSAITEPAEVGPEVIAEPKSAGKDEIPSTRVTALARPEPEEPDTVHVIVPSGGASREASMTGGRTGSVATPPVVSISPGRSSADRGGRGRLRRLFGFLEPKKKTWEESKRPSAILEGEASVVDSAERRAKGIGLRLSKTNFAKFAIVSLLPFFLGRDQGGSNQYSAENPESDTHPITSTYGNPETFLRDELHGLIKKIFGPQSPIKANDGVNPFYIPTPDRPNPNVTPFQPEPGSPPVWEQDVISMNEPGESIKGWAEKYVAFMTNRDLAVRALKLGKERGLPVMDPDEYINLTRLDFAKAQEEFAKSYERMEQSRVQIPASDSELSEAKKRLNPLLVEDFSKKLVDSAKRNNVSPSFDPQKPDQLLEQLTYTEPPLKLYREAVSTVQNNAAE